MVHFIQDINPDYVADFCQIGYETCFRVHFTLNSDPQGIVMSVPVRVGAFSKYFQVLFQRPIGP